MHALLARRSRVGHMQLQARCLHVSPALTLIHWPLLELPAPAALAQQRTHAVLHSSGRQVPHAIAGPSAALACPSGRPSAGAGGSRRSCCSCVGRASFNQLLSLAARDHERAATHASPAGQAVQMSARRTQGEEQAARAAAAAAAIITWCWLHCLRGGAGVVSPDGAPGAPHKGVADEDERPPASPKHSQRRTVLTLLCTPRSKQQSQQQVAVVSALAHGKQAAVHAH